MFIFTRPPQAVLVALTLAVLLDLLDGVFDLEICMPLTNAKVLEGVFSAEQKTEIIRNPVNVPFRRACLARLGSCHRGAAVHGATDGMNDPNAALPSNIAFLPPFERAARLPAGHIRGSPADLFCKC